MLHGMDVLWGCGVSDMGFGGVACGGVDWRAWRRNVRGSMNYSMKISIHPHHDEHSCELVFGKYEQKASIVWNCWAPQISSANWGLNFLTEVNAECGAGEWWQCWVLKLASEEDP